MATLEEVDIPANAWKVKAWFWERPGDDVVREIKKFIKAGNPPHLWRGHTHTKPPANSLPVYLDEVDIPGPRNSPSSWATCPCCTPRFPKWRKNGKIAWFPQEGVIRIIGSDCFEALNPEGHREAVAALRIDQRRKQNINYLLSNLGSVPRVLTMVAAALPLANALDEFRDSLLGRLSVFMPSPLWDKVRDGNLKVRVKRSVTRRSRDGRETTIEVSDLEVYGTIAGFQLLDPRLKRFSGRLEAVLKKLRNIDHGNDAAAAVATMDGGEREKAASVLGSAMRTADEIFQQLREARQFLSASTIATLRRWGSQPGALARLYVRRENRNFYIGETREEQMRIELDPAIDKVLGKLPVLGQRTRDYPQGSH